jgi:regulator of replication initiation timing
MTKGNEVRAGPAISEEIEREAAKLRELFEDVEPAKAKLVEGLISDAAFLKVQNDRLKRILTESGMVLIHPENPKVQKPVEAARQYLKNANAYAVVIKTLNGVLSKNVIDPDDGLGEYE